LQEKGIDLEFRDLDKQRLTARELDELIGDRDYREFLNTRNELYRARNMKEHPPSRTEAIKLMVAEPNLIRRPVVIAGGKIILGYDEEALKKLK
jgi:arsenate reductase-like glutaredoxin family protein